MDGYAGHPVPNDSVDESLTNFTQGTKKPIPDEGDGSFCVSLKFI